MLTSPARLSLRIPESPIQRQAFRSSCFRRILVTTITLALCLATVISIHGKNELRSKLARDYVQLQQTIETPSRLLHLQDVERAQVLLDVAEKTTKGRPHAIEQLMDHLPEVLRIPFEEAVADVELDGWEDAWLSAAHYDSENHGHLSEPKIDFVYNWVNGSEDGFKASRHKYEVNSPLNDVEGKWAEKHAINRFRDWDELRYSFRSLDRYARNFTNKVQLLVNSVPDTTSNDTGKLRPQRPTWLKDDDATRENVQILSQEDFFGEKEKQCLPSFDSLSLESQIHNTPSAVDQLVALSDDMFLGAPHSAADFYSPLFGSMMGFKSSHYNVKGISSKDVPTFGEKPHLYYTSWLLNHRFGERERKVQAHFTHSISRRVMKEAMSSFPSPALRGACERFRGESKYQIYPWYTAFHYSIERFREVLLWSFVRARADTNGDGYLDWSERQAILAAIKPGRKAFSGEDASTPNKLAEGRDRLFYQLHAIHKKAGLQPPLSNVKVLWTSLDGPETIRDVKCHNFHIDKCFAESFDSPMSDTSYPNPDFSASNILAQLSHREPKCGDCVIKFMLSTVPRGLEPLLPPKSHRRERELVVKALMKYQHTVIDPDAMFVMVKDAEQVETELLDRTIKREKRVSQWCFNDDVMTEDEKSVANIRGVIQTVFETLFPTKGRWER